MAIWHPRQNIRVIAIGLIWRNRSVLAAEVLDDTGRIKGARPLGGGVEFGETWQQALIREFQEELSVKIYICGKPLVMENIYTHEDISGHEVVFIANVEFPDGVFDGQDSIRFSEDNGVECIARWFDLADLDNGVVELYPAGLKTILQAE
jgi:hypothetical protein